MRTTETSPILARLFSELIDGANSPAGAFILNAGDAGLLRSLDKISAADASRSVNDGATIAAHAQHVLSGMEHRPPGVSPRRHQTDQQARAWAKRRNVLAAVTAVSPKSTDALANSRHSARRSHAPLRATPSPASDADSSVAGATRTSRRGSLRRADKAASLRTSGVLER
jgi:hypothetical protein